MPKLTSAPPTFIHEPVVFMTKSTPRPRFLKPNYRKDCPTYSHCGVVGHNVEKCYKVHGYPLGFKFTQSKRAPHSANQVQQPDLSNFHQLNVNTPQLSMIF
jgi:hypothetical protein